MTSVLLLTMGCGKSHGHTSASEFDEHGPSSKPTLADMLKVTILELELPLTHLSWAIPMKPVRVTWVPVKVGAGSVAA